LRTGKQAVFRMNFSAVSKAALDIERAIRLCHNVILSVSEGSRLLNYRRDSSVALLPQNDKMVILRDYDTVSMVNDEVLEKEVNSLISKFEG